MGGGVSWAAGSDEENDDGVDDLLAWSDTLDFDEAAASPFFKAAFTGNMCSPVDRLVKTPAGN